MSKGRDDEARAVLAQVGESEELDDFGDEAKESTRWRTLFDREYITRTVFSCVFWICIVVPYFALTFFQSEVLGTIGLKDPVSAALIGTCVALVGAAIGWLLIDRVGRRAILLTPMFATGVFLAVVALSRTFHLPVTVTVAARRGVLHRLRRVVFSRPGDRGQVALRDRQPRGHEPQGRPPPRTRGGLEVARRSFTKRGQIVLFWSIETAIGRCDPVFVTWPKP